MQNLFDLSDIKSAKVTDPLAGTTKQQPRKGNFVVARLTAFVPENFVTAWEGLGFSADPDAQAPGFVGVSKAGHTFLNFEGHFQPDDDADGSTYGPITDRNLRVAFPIVCGSGMAEKSKNGWISMSTAESAPVWDAFGHPLSQCEELNRPMPDGANLASIGEIIGDVLAQISDGKSARMGCYIGTDRKTGYKQPTLTAI